MKKLFNFNLTPTPLKRAFFFVISDFTIITINIFIGFTVKYGFSSVLFNYLTIIFHTVIMIVIVKISVYFVFNAYKITWQYVGLDDLFNLLKANLVSLIIFIAVYIFRGKLYLAELPKSVILIEFVTTIIFTGFLRISKRLFLEILKTRYVPEGKNTIIIGAGSEAEMVIRDLRKSNYKDFKPVAILDNNPDNHGLMIHNIPVRGSLNQLEKTIKKEKPASIIIADKNISLKNIKSIYSIAQKSGIQDVKRIPKMYDEKSLDFSVKKLSQLNIEDLLKREEVQVDKDSIRNLILDKKVIITGAAGSIGSEICRQVSFLKPQLLILYEIDETETFFLEKELQEKFPELGERLITIIGDIKDNVKLESVFKKYSPEIVFHTAAYKHVPLMEENPEEAVKVNIIGTFKLCDLSVKYKVSKFINISTDKAVMPESVMGASKRVGEYIARAHGDIGYTQFISVRFGNVLGSRGSVLPVFLKQLENGGPLTITHKNMRRYFMSIPEAVSLVLEAGFLGKSGEIMVLDMGEPVYIQEFAEELIRLHGFEINKDIEIVYTGIRPGEKLYEELLTAEEGTLKTSHERVFTAKISKEYSIQEIKKFILKLDRLLVAEPTNLMIKQTILDFVYFRNKELYNEENQ